METITVPVKVLCDLVDIAGEACDVGLSMAKQAEEAQAKLSAVPPPAKQVVLKKVASYDPLKVERTVEQLQKLGYISQKSAEALKQDWLADPSKTLDFIEKFAGHVSAPPQEGEPVGRRASGSQREDWLDTRV